jgi:glycosyltransferase involved in cell wall biosynthesis
LGTPIVLNLRDTKGAHEADNSASYRRRFRLIDALLVLSEEMAHFYRQMAARARFQIDRIRWKSIYSIVDFNRMKRLEPMDRSRLRVSLGMPAERLALGVVAAFNNKKNQLEFIEKACDLICRRLPQAHIYFVGDFRPDSDPYARQCQQAIDSLAVRAQITTTGFCPQVEKWYQSLDLIIIPTRKEGLARCMIEGLACGTPIVSFDVCSAKEILTRHDCGVVVSQGNYADLVDATVRLAENPGEWKRLGDNGFAIARRLFHREEVIRQYKLLYRELQE